MHGLSKEQKQKLLKYVLLTGGNTKVPGFDKRIKSELRMMNEVSSEINVVRSYDE